MTRTMLGRWARPLSVAAILTFGMTARAQYVAHMDAGNYFPLGAESHVHPIKAGFPGVSGTVTGTDNGQATITLGASSPWTFSWGGYDYSSVTVSANGFLVLNRAPLPDGGDPGATNYCYCDGGAPACDQSYQGSCGLNGGTACGAGGTPAMTCCAVPNACENGGTICGGGCCTECGPTSGNGASFGSAATIQPTVVAPWMEDLDDTASNGIQYIDGVDTVGNHFLTIDFNGVITSLFSGTNLEGTFNECSIFNGYCCGQSEGTCHLSSYQFSVTLYQLASTGVIVMSYGDTVFINPNYGSFEQNTPDNNPAAIGVEDENSNLLQPLSCSQFNQCAPDFGTFPSQQTFFYYDPYPGPPATVVPSQLHLDSTGFTPGVDGGQGMFTFQVSTNVRNLGGSDVTGSLSYDVFLAKSPIGVVNPSPILTQPGNLCTDAGFPCLGAFSQSVPPGDLPAIADGGFGSQPTTVVYPGASLSVSTGSFSVPVPPPAGVGGGPGIYYPQISFNTGGAAQTTITSSQGFKLGADPAGYANPYSPLGPTDTSSAISLGSTQRDVHGTFTANVQLANYGYVADNTVNFTLYLVPETACGSDYYGNGMNPCQAGCIYDGGFNVLAPTTPQVGNYTTSLPAYSFPVVDPITGLADAGIGSIAAGQYWVVGYINPSNNNDVDPTNNYFCSAQPLGVYPPHLFVDPGSIVAKPVCYIPFVDGGVGDSGLPVSELYPCDVDYSVANNGLEIAENFNIGVYLHAASRNAPPNPRLDSPMNQTTFGEQFSWGPMTLGANCTVHVQQVTVDGTPNLSFNNFNPAGCGSYATTGDPVPTYVQPRAPTYVITPGKYVAGVFGDVLGGIQNLHADTNKANSTNPTIIKYAFADITSAAGDVNPPPYATGGEPMHVERVISNTGVYPSGPVPYSYFLSAIGLTGPAGVPVAFIIDGGYSYTNSTVPLAYQGEPGTALPATDNRPDTVLVPSSLATGHYTLSLVIDPLGVTRELNTDNKTTKATNTISVTASPLQIVSNTNLPVAVVKQPYQYQLQAQGGFYANTWSIVGGTLPPGMTPAVPAPSGWDGTLGGTPTEAGEFTFVVQVQSGQQTQIAVMILTVTEAAAPLQIISPSDTLPPATVGEPYSLQLQAQGGVQPYFWSGAPPPNNNFQLTSSGLITGLPTVPTGKPVDFSVTVTDKLGNSATANLRLQVVTSAQLIITTDPSTCISTNYASCPASVPLQAINTVFQVTFFPVETDGLTHIYTWTFPKGQALPTGVNAVAQPSMGGSPATLVVSGKPGQTGIYPFRVEVTDESQHVATRHAILVVTGVPLSAGQQTLPDATPGANYGPVQLVAGSTTQSYTWLLYSGALPAGLSLGSDGSISGTVAPACSASADGGSANCNLLQPYVFAAAISDGLGDQAVIPASINVTLGAGKSGGCSSAGGSTSLLALLALALLLRRRERAVVRVSCRSLARTGFILGAMVLLASTQALAQASWLQAQTGSCTYTVADGGPAFVDISPAAPGGGGVLVFPQKTNAGKILDARTPELAVFGVRLPFSVPMPGVTASEFKIQSNGMLIEAGQLQQALTSWTDCLAFPYTGAPSAGGAMVKCPPPYIALAPWWGDMSLCSSRNASMTYQLPANGSTAPAIFQWTNVSDDDACSNRAGVNTYTFQIQINSDGNIYYVYAPDAGTQSGINQECGSLNQTCNFAIGAQSGDQFTGYTTNGIGVLCNPGCGAPDFPAGQTVALQLNPQIFLTNFTVGGNASVDGTVTIDLFAQNGGPSNADTVIGFYYSTDPNNCVNVDPTLPLLGSLGPEDGGIFLGCSPEPQEVRGDIQLAAANGVVASGTGFLIAASIVNGVPVYPTCFPLVVGPAQPDFTCDGGLGGIPSSSVAPGAALNLNFNLLNLGASPMQSVPYGYFISRSPTPTPVDFDLGDFKYALLANVAQGSPPVNVPNTLNLATAVAPGTYTVGVIINPQSTISERSTTNNLCVSPTKLKVICNGPPKVTAATLPDGYTQVQYQAVLAATCGDGTYTWSLGTGQAAKFPPGLSLGSDGIITGVPTAPPGDNSGNAVTYQFDVTVTDAQMPAQTGTATMSIKVNSYNAPLAIVTNGLPSGLVADPYSAILSATGGKPPYRWCAPGASCPWSAPGTINPLQGTLPLGLLLSADGVVKGVPTAGGPYQFQVAVQDSASTPSTVTSAFFVVNIGEPGRIAITTSTLPLAAVGKYYQSAITAEGGQTPYSWQVVGTQRLPSGPGDPGETLGAVAPKGMAVDPASGNITGTPQVAGTYSIQLQATDSSKPPESTVNAVFLTIIPANGLQILNTYLPQATVGHAYSVQLDTNAIDPTSVTFTAVDTAGNPSSSMLPGGINVTPTGQIQGTPTSTGSTDFLVQAQDNQSRVVIQALRLTVESAPAKSGGCAVAPGESSGLSALLLLGLVALQARRRRDGSKGKSQVAGERNGPMSFRRGASRILSLAVVLVIAGSARAQYYATVPGSYIPLGSAGLPVDQKAAGQPAGEVSGVVTGTDNGVATITFGGTANPWSFTYTSNHTTYSGVAVSVDGWITLIGGGSLPCGCKSDTDPNAPSSCSAPFTACASGCGSTVAGATGCCLDPNACVAAPGGCNAATQTCGASCCSSCGPNNATAFGGNNFDAYYYNMPQPGMIGGWIEDLDDTASKGIRYLDGTDALGNHFLTIDYHGVRTSPNISSSSVGFCSFSNSGGASTYNFSITLYQPASGNGIVAVSYGDTEAVAGGSADMNYAGLGVVDDLSYTNEYPPLVPQIPTTQNYNNNCYNPYCGLYNEGFNNFFYYEGCTAACGAFPTGNTYLYYDSDVPSQSLLVSSAVVLTDAGYDAGNGFPSVTLTLESTINNLGGGNVPDASVNYSVYLSTGVIQGVGKVCPGNNLPCLGDYSQPVATGTLAPFNPSSLSTCTISGSFGVPPSARCLGNGPTVDTSAFTVPIPSVNAPSEWGIYYASMNFGGGSPVEMAVSGPIEFGPDPAAVSVGQVPPLPKPDGTFSVKPRMQNVGFVEEKFFSFSLYLSKDGCDAGFDATKAPYLGTFDSGYAGPLAALSGSTEYPVTTLPPTTDAGIVQAGSYSVVVVVQSTDDLDTGNNTACSGNQIAISPPNLKTQNVRAPGLCYVAPPDGGNAHYGCDVPYEVSNVGTELAVNFNMGVYAQAYYKGPSPNPLVAAQMYYPDVNFRRGVWGPITLGGQCTMTVSGFGQIVSFSPPGCGTAPGVNGTPGSLPPQMAMPEEFPNTTVFGDVHNPLPADYQIAVFADPDGLVPGTTAGREKAALSKTVIAFADPDLTVFAGDLIAPSDATAGAPMTINKIIRNIGPIAGGAPYEYFLSSVGLVGTNGVPVPVLVDGGITYLPTTGVLQPSSNAGTTAADRDQSVDTLIVPAGLATGTYTLTIAVDPLAATPQVHRDNKLQTAEGPITINASPIQVLNTSLPVGVVGETYPTIQLDATGGFEAYAWTVIAGNLTQSGLTLSPTGVISGVPTTPGDYSFAAQVTSGQQSQILALFLTVTTASGPLQITSPSPLPPATVGQYYSQQIQAQGGVPPYRWTGQAPGGLTLDPSGLLVGTPGAPTNGEQSFSVTVTDYVGNQVTGTLSVSVVPASAITISTDAYCQSVVNDGGYCQATVPPLAVGDQLFQAFYAFEADGKQHGYTWTFPAGQPLPAGMLPPVQQGQAFVLSGTPTQVGIFPFSMVVADEEQRTTSRQFALVVNATPFNDGLVQLPNATPGAVYGPVTLTTAQGMTAVTWSLYSGELPPGVAVNSDGTIGGTVPNTATPRAYSFVAAVQTSGGGLALLPSAISVVAPAVKSGGCQSAGGDFSVLALGVGLFFLVRRRRLVGAMALGGVVALVVASPASAQVCTYVPNTNAQNTVSFLDISQTGKQVAFVSGKTQVPKATIGFPVTPLGFTMPAPGIPSGISFVKVQSNGILVDKDAKGAQVDPTGCGFPFSWGASNPSALCPEPAFAVAPWFGNLSLCYGDAGVTYLATPTQVTFQWTNATFNEGDTCGSATDNTFPVPAMTEAFTFQTILHSSGDIDFVYAPAVHPTAGLGLLAPFFAGAESGTINPYVGNGYGAFPCNGGCDDNNYPPSLVAPATPITSVTLQNAPNVQALLGGFTVGGTAALDGPVTASVDLQNFGPLDSTTAEVLIFFNAGGCPAPLPALYTPTGSVLATLGLNDSTTPLGDAGVPGCGNAITLTGKVLLDSTKGVAQGAGALVAVVANGGNTPSRQCQTLAIGPPLADFQASALFGIGTPDAGYPPGTTLSLSWDLINNGSSVSSDVEYGYFISRGAIPTAFDYLIPFTSGAVDDAGLKVISGVNSGNDGLISDSMTIPSTFQPGVYTVAVIIDPRDQYQELNKQNNTAVSASQLVIICPGVPTVTGPGGSDALPDGSSGLYYQGVLTSSCGDGTYTYSLADAGALPVGLSLGAKTGLITGVPNETGSSSFTVNVTDSRGAMGSGNFTLKIGAYSAPLAIATTELPAANFGEFYTVKLTALGGAPPYQWCGPGAMTQCPWGGLSTVQGQLPPGILLSADGILSGIPAGGGSSSFQVQVRDSTGDLATSSYFTVNVTAPGRLIVATNSLPVAFLEQPYNTDLAAAGGKGPYSHDPNAGTGSMAGWLILDTKRLPSSVSDYGADLGPVPPPGLTLDLGGKLSGTPTQAGNFTLLVQVTDSSLPPQVATDVVLLTIVPANGLQILNTALPQASLRQNYSIALQTTAQDPKSVVFVPVDSSGHNSPAARASLPPGITLSQDGVLSGVPTVTGSYPFLVQATDGQGRIVIQALQTTVVQAPSLGGCATSPGRASGASGLLLLGLIALGLFRRNRR